MRKLVDSINQADMLRMFTMDIEKVEDESRSEGKGKVLVNIY